MRAIITRGLYIFLPLFLTVVYILVRLILGAIFMLRKDLGVGGWSIKWLYSLPLFSENVLTGVGGLEKAKNTLM